MRTALAMMLALLPAVAAAEGEHSPMIGGAAVGAVAGETAHGGAQLDAAWWHWRLGLAAETSLLWSTDAQARHAAVLGVSARILVLETPVESWLEPRDVELGIELQAIVERAWWIEQDPHVNPMRLGVGIAIRLRGGDEYDVSSLLAESRLFVRVMKSPSAVDDMIARSTAPVMDHFPPLMLMVGVGAAWGTGEPDYLERFRSQPFSPSTRRRLASGWFE